jgi:hypothetical protein
MQNILPDAAEHGCEGEDSGHAHAYKGKKYAFFIFYIYVFTFLENILGNFRVLCGKLFK